MVLILESYFFVNVLLQHSDACIYQSYEVGDRSSQRLQSHPSNQLFITSDVFQFRQGLVDVRRVAKPNGPKKNAVSFTPDLIGQSTPYLPSCNWTSPNACPLCKRWHLGQLSSDQGMELGQSDLGCGTRHLKHR
jgi:hypothetical protein